MKELERENGRLKQLVGDLSLDNAILKEAARQPVNSISPLSTPCRAQAQVTAASESSTHSVEHIILPSGATATPAPHESNCKVAYH